MHLSDEIQKKLRSIGKIKNDEVLLKEGDLLIAVNVITQQRRIIDKDSELVEALNLNHKPGGKRILKG